MLLNATVTIKLYNHLQKLFVDLYFFLKKIEKDISYVFYEQENIMAIFMIRKGDLSAMVTSKANKDFALGPIIEKLLILYIFVDGNKKL